MAMVIAIRIQDDFPSIFHPIVLTSFALARRAGRLRGLRTDSPIFGADLSLRLLHAQRGFFKSQLNAEFLV
jgi:hypothetical protein